jgi:hypothetical protein
MRKTGCGVLLLVGLIALGVYSCSGFKPARNEQTINYEVVGVVDGPEGKDMRVLVDPGTPKDEVIKLSDRLWSENRLALLSIFDSPDAVTNGFVHTSTGSRINRHWLTLRCKIDGKDSGTKWLH